MRFLTWCNKIDERSELLFASARHFGIDVEPIGLGKEYRGGVSKIEWLHTFLQSLHPDEIVVCTDAFDCIWLRDADGMEDVFEDFAIRDGLVVYAAEKWYRKRPADYHSVFDNWTTVDEVDTIYRYPNCGCVMGVAFEIEELLDDALAMIDDEQLSEQWYMTKAIADYKLSDIDKCCDLFWCCAGQWKMVPKLARIENGRLTNLKTGGQPYVLHAPIPNRSRALLRDIAGKLGVPLP